MTREFSTYAWHGVTGRSTGPSASDSRSGPGTRCAHGGCPDRRARILRRVIRFPMFGCISDPKDGRRVRAR